MTLRIEAGDSASGMRWARVRDPHRLAGRQKGLHQVAEDLPGTVGKPCGIRKAVRGSKVKLLKNLIFLVAVARTEGSR